MKTMIIGGYSTLSDPTDADSLVCFSDNHLAPLLQYLYKNAHFEFTLYISSVEMDWIEKNRPAMQKLIYRLIKRRTLSLLISSKNHCFMPISTSQEVVEQTEQMRFLTRKYYRSKGRGFFAFGGFWSTELISKLVKSDISYAVIPTCTRNKLQNGSFFMVEHGKRFVVYPSDFFIHEKISDYAADSIDFDKMKSDIEKYVLKFEKDVAGSFFLDIDKLVRNKKNSLLILDSLFHTFKDNSFNFFNTDNDISFLRMDYLESGSYSYGEEYISNIFKSDEYVNRVAIINYLYAICSDKTISRKDRDILKPFLSLVSYGEQFLTLSNTDDRYTRVMAELLNELCSNSSVPQIYDLSSMGLVIVVKKSYLAIVDTLQGCIRKVISSKNGKNLCFDSLSFRDVIQDSKKQQCFAKYGSFSLVDINDGSVEMVYQNNSTGFSLSKIFNFTQTNISCDINLCNIQDKTISFSYGQFFYFDKCVDLDGNAKNNSSAILPLISAPMTGCLNISIFAKTLNNSFLSSLDFEKIFIPYHDITLESDEEFNFTYSFSIPRITYKEKKTSIDEAKEC